MTPARWKVFYEDQVRAVLGIPDHVRVIFLLAIGRLRGLDGRYPGRLPASRTVFAGRYGEPFNSEPNEIPLNREKDHA